MSEKKTKKFKKGDRVPWNSSQGTVEGSVLKSKTKGHTVGASPVHPEVLVESEKTGAPAAQHPGALRETLAAPNAGEPSGGGNPAP